MRKDKDAPRKGRNRSDNRSGGGTGGRHTPAPKNPAAQKPLKQGLPDKETLKAFILASDTAMDKREIARAFGVTGQERTMLRVMLRELSEEGGIGKTPSRRYGAVDALPETGMIEITGMDGSEMMARPLQWEGRSKPPRIYVLDRRKGGKALKAGDKVMAHFKKSGHDGYDAIVVKSPDDAQAGDQIIGIFKPYKDHAYVIPTNKKIKEDFLVPPEFMGTAEIGDLVIIAPAPSSFKYPKSKNPSRVVEVLGKAEDPKLISLIGIHSHGIPTVFPPDVIAESESFSEPDLSDGREDLRDIPLVTIDGADARDFDDAVYAEPDTDPKNAGGWKIIVAIADVSYYVRPFTPLDREAFNRGNSTYFADRVVPMLPERLSNDLCSLRPKVNRACLAAHMVIDKDARLVKWRFARGLMRSAARLTYEQVQDAKNGAPDDTTGPLLETVIQPLYKAYSLLKRAREIRGALELDLPERKAVIKNGIVEAIVPRVRLDSHQLIEEFMILANVAAAEELEKKNAPCIYRVHDRPSFDRIEAARGVLKDMGYNLPKTDDLHPKSLNHMLKASTEAGDAALVHTLLLRTQSQAIYHPDNIGHFGLALEKYAHFTSPIRRYADLVVHRSLVRSNKLGQGGLSDQEAAEIYAIAEHISVTERRSMLAERDVMDRFTAQYLKDRIGNIFAGKVSSVTSFGLFVNLDESGADGIVPMRNLPSDYYIHDEAHHKLTGRHTGQTFQLSDPVLVRLLDADAMRGSTVFEIVGSEAGTGGERQSHRQKQRYGEQGRHRKNDDRRKNDRGGGKKRHKDRKKRR